MSKRVVHVDIQGQKYAVRSDLDPQYIAELAKRGVMIKQI